ncbi:DUF1338 domain-containing protein [Litorimonas cladophorae]|uniref:2-oxoadipate dioxygenase/decarboxylase n=1 Tax=Litorimonas cladophorae TaxID=1220491 RepID=A0A918KT22_9PROT|nr:VOC family protein [Litorimonas cladophorae]GGX76091.1 DUF1338 domain-containing protein [Litorimonas cladophorae]
MTTQAFRHSDHLRADFSQALSDMYRTEVPAYGTLIDIVGRINAEHEGIRSEGERHGAIRLGTASELHLIARVFEIFGLHPVGYYDLSVAGLPVHSTAFRPITDQGFNTSPFRMFTSLLRLDMISAPLRETAELALNTRSILSEEGHRLLDLAENQGGLTDDQGDAFVREAVAIFAWRKRAHVDLATYKLLKSEHPLIADIVSFQGPHMNHLTPRVADIDAAHHMMAAEGMDIKDTIEGPPRRNVPILLRQTAFKALTETVDFQTDIGWESAEHTARFGEIEQRGAALTPKGRALYDQCLASKDFSSFPDDIAALRDQKLAYFNAEGEPVTYEDFLPVSAAGIFKSNLRESEDVESLEATGNQAAFETALGKPVLDMFDLYANAT